MFCSRKCAAGSGVVRQSRIETCIEKYGVDNPSKITVIKEKKKSTLLTNYGTTSLNGNEIINERRRNTNIKRYGYVNPFCSDAVQSKIQQQNIERYGRPFVGSNIIPEESFLLLNDGDWLQQQHINDNNTLWRIAQQLGVNATTVANYCRIHDINIQRFMVSDAEQQICNRLRENNPNLNIQQNVRTIIYPLEIDIYLPDCKIAIEYCGLYWHSEQAGKDRHYHKRKLDMCNAKGIRLITVFEDEWIKSPTLVINKILNILHLQHSVSIGARKCDIVTVSYRDRYVFLNEFHIQGNGPGSICYGLTYADTLVAVMVFIKNKCGKFILNRYATSTSIPGGFSKLLNHFCKTHEYHTITTFADLRWSNGDLYSTTGFVLDSTQPPDYYYVYKSTRIHKFNFRHKSMAKRLPAYDPLLSENENTRMHNIYRIWNCGLNKYVKYYSSVTENN
jgi:hypothetical protein